MTTISTCIKIIDNVKALKRIKGNLEYLSVCQYGEGKADNNRDVAKDTAERLIAGS